MIHDYEQKIMRITIFLSGGFCKTCHTFPLYSHIPGYLLCGWNSLHTVFLPYLKHRNGKIKASSKQKDPDRLKAQRKRGSDFIMAHPNAADGPGERPQYRRCSSVMALR